MIELHELRSLFNYDPGTGLFTWRQTGKGRKAIVGSNSHGYISIRLTTQGKKVAYLAHRLAWLYTYGEWPKNLIDHIDMNRSNNDIANLREATHSTNKANRKAPANNSTGFKGVSFNKVQGKFQASICRQYQQKHLGFFDTAEAAHAAYVSAANDLFGEFARTG